MGRPRKDGTEIQGHTADQLLTLAKTRRDAIKEQLAPLDALNDELVKLEAVISAMEGA